MPATNKKKSTATPGKASSSSKSKPAPKKKAATPKKAAVPKKATSTKKTPVKAKKAVSQKMTIKKAPAKKASAKKATSPKKATPSKAVKKKAVGKTAKKSNSQAAKSKTKAKPKPETKGTVKKGVAKKAASKTRSATKGATQKTTGKGSSKKQSSAISVPATSVERVKSARPHAFTFDDIDEVLQTHTPSSIPQKTAKGKGKLTEETGFSKAPPLKKQAHAPASLADILGFNPAENIKPEEKAMAEVPKKFLKNFKDLKKLRTQVLESLDFHTESSLRRSAKEDSGDLSGYGQHQADAGTDNYDRDFALSLVSDEQELLFEIEEAIKRIHNGSYGLCEVTGKPINKERLNAVPFARFSLEGQVEFEKTQRRRSQRGGIFDTPLDEVSTFGGHDDGDD